MKRDRTGTVEARSAALAVWSVARCSDWRHASHRADDARAELEQTQVGGAERRRREGCPGQGPQAEEMQQMVGERVEQEPKGVGAEGLTREPIGGAVSLLADARTHCTGCRCTRSA